MRPLTLRRYESVGYDGYQLNRNPRVCTVGVEMNDFRVACIARQLASSKKAVEQHRKYDQGEHHVHAVALFGKPKDRKRDSGHWSRDQQ